MHAAASLFCGVGSRTHGVSLNRPIHGLKQSPRCWNKRLSECLQNLAVVVHFRRADADICLFVTDLDGKMLVLLVYVDDILVGETCENSGGAGVAHLMSTFRCVIWVFRHFVWDHRPKLVLELAPPWGHRSMSNLNPVD